MSRYPSEALRDLLARHMLFRGVPAEVVSGLVRFAIIKHFEAGKEVFAKGDVGDALYGVLSGRVCICTDSSEGDEVLLNILDPGEFFGEIALLDGGTRTASARAMTDIDVLRIRRENFLPFLHSNPELCVAMISVLCSRIRMNVEFIEDAVFLHLTARLAKRLQALSEQHGKACPRGTRIDVKLSRQDLAHMVGVTRERVSRELSLLREEGVIATEEGMIVICKPERLKELQVQS
ncbi:MAG TPA: Crp/Fnr family transcriptional regulator [Stellaceae bacterium]|nr:Crp/Fnr family transcriptional regulator [Stellaceae bacterium]